MIIFVWSYSNINIKDQKKFSYKHMYHHMQLL